MFLGIGGIVIEKTTPHPQRKNLFLKILKETSFVTNNGIKINGDIFDWCPYSYPNYKDEEMFEFLLMFWHFMFLLDDYFEKNLNGIYIINPWQNDFAAR